MVAFFYFTPTIGETSRSTIANETQARLHTNVGPFAHKRRLVLQPTSLRLNIIEPAPTIKQWHITSFQTKPITENKHML